MAPESEITTAPKIEGAPRIENADETAAKEGGPKLVGADGQELVAELPEERDWTKIQFPIELFENRLAIKRDDSAEISKGGIHLPPGSMSRTMTGTVVGVGPGMMKANCDYIPLQGVPPIKVGDRVVFEQFRSMIEVFVEGRVYHITRDNDLLGRAGGAVRISCEDI